MVNRLFARLPLRSAGLIFGAIALTLMLSRIIGQGAVSQLFFIVPAVVGGIIAFITLSDWRKGLLLFIIWFTFEDLIRKYMGNNMLIFFAKDGLLALIYLSFFFQYMKGNVRFFRPPFLVPLLLVIWFGFVQVFNPTSNSIYFGLFGFKLYFYYVPLMFLSYELIQSEKSLRRFLVFNLCVASIVAVLGITQSIVGPDFLNPEALAPELEALNRLVRIVDGVEGQRAAVFRPTGVFLSDGRFSNYMMIMCLLGLGTLTYFLVKSTHLITSLVIQSSCALLTLALFMSGSRGSVLTILLLSLMTTVVLLIGWIARQQLMPKNILQRILPFSVVIGVVTVAFVSLFSSEITSRWDFYRLGLNPFNPENDLVHRVSGFQTNAIWIAFTQPTWMTGAGIGTASQAVPYIERLLNIPTTARLVEQGYGTIIIELGMIGLLFWLIWTAALLFLAAKTVYQLRGTALFPVALAIFWFIFSLIGPHSFSMAFYQNYISNIYLWLLVGILFRLPALLVNDTPDRQAIKEYAP